MKSFVSRAVFTFSAIVLILVLMVCTVGHAWAGLCQTCTKTTKAATMGAECSVTVEEEGPGGPTSVTYPGTYVSDVSYKVCEKGVGLFCSNSAMTVQAKCGYNPQPNVADLSKSVDIPVTGCGE